MSIALVVFGRQPSPGRCKRRLAATIGDRSAARVQQRWLVFEQLRKLHFQHVQRTAYESFEDVLAGSSHDHLWRYAEERTYAKGQVLQVKSSAREA